MYLQKLLSTLLFITVLNSFALNYSSVAADSCPDRIISDSLVANIETKSLHSIIECVSQHYGNRTIAKIDAAMQQSTTVIDSIIDSYQALLSSLNGSLDVRFIIKNNGALDSLDITASSTGVSLIDTQIIKHLSALQFGAVSNDRLGSCFTYRITYSDSYTEHMQHCIPSRSKFSQSPMTRHLMFQSAWMLQKGQIRYTQKELTHGVLEIGLSENVTLQANTDWLLMMYSLLSSDPYYINGGLGIKVGHTVAPTVRLSGALTLYAMPKFEVFVVAPNFAATLGNNARHVTLGINVMHIKNCDFLFGNNLFTSSFYVGTQFQFRPSFALVTENSLVWGIIRDDIFFGASSPLSNGVAARFMFRKSTLDLGANYTMSFKRPTLWPYVNVVFDIKRP